MRTIGGLLRTLCRSLPGRKNKHWSCKSLDTLQPIYHRQSLIAGWDQEAYAKLKVELIGAGGLGGEVLEGIVKKGAHSVDVVDFDIVTPTNLNRQKFDERSLYKNKAEELCRRLSKEGFLGTRLIAHACRFQELDPGRKKADLIVCGVDNQLPDTRLKVCRYAYINDIPAVFLAVSTNADVGYVFVQIPDQACWACAFKPEFSKEEAETGGMCPGVPACVDILKVVAGYALYAMDSLFMDREKGDWNQVIVSLKGSDLASMSNVAERRGCIVCGERKGRS